MSGGVFKVKKHKGQFECLELVQTEGRENAAIASESAV
jgi:hypothetical protein